MCGQADPRFSKEGWYFLSRTEKYVRGICVMPVRHVTSSASDIITC